MKKEPKSYHKLYELNRELKVHIGMIWSLYVLAVMLFIISFGVETATVGNYILSKLDVEKSAVTAHSWDSRGYDESDWVVVRWGNSSHTYPSYSSTETLATGACIDRAQTIINTLKRRYVAFDRIKAATSDSHVQAVRQNIDGTIDFLKLDDRNVVIGKSEFPSGFDKLIKPDDFLEAIEYFRPEIDIAELQAYLDKKYKREDKK